MRIQSMAAGLVPLAAAALAMAGCNRSAPTATVAQADSYVASSGAFAALPAADLQSAASDINTCNLDTIGGKPASGQALSHSGAMQFAGWAADTSTGTVPAGVKLVLKGAQDYAVNAATGQLRTDVAAATRMPALATSGYAVDAELAAVAPGDYQVLLLFQSGGKAQRCPTKVTLSVQ